MNGSSSDSLLLLYLLASVGGVAEWAALKTLLRRRPPRLVTRNYRQAEVVSRGGVTFAQPLIAGVVLARFAGADDGTLLPAAFAATLFGLLGWLDDAWGTPGVRGLKGHFAHLIRARQVTTGLVKAVGGAGVGLWAAYMLGADGWEVLPGGALIALSANAANALDARPGRTVKLFVLAAAALIVVMGARPDPIMLGLLAPLLGAALVFAPADLRERVMLGDTGANPLGAVLGITVVGVTRWPTWVALALALLAFCLAADRWSLTTALERTPGLRWLDRLGRPKTP